MKYSPSVVGLTRAQWGSSDEQGKSNPYTALDRPLGLQEVGTPKTSRLSAHEGGKVVSFTPAGTYFCHRLSRPQGHSATVRIIAITNPSDP